MFESPAFSQQEIVAALQVKVPFVCACCNRYHRDRRGNPSDPNDPASIGCTPYLYNECGSPLSDFGFPEYRGPLEATDFGLKCFLCAQAADYQIILVQHGAELNGVFGLCAGHWDDAHRRVSKERDRRGTNATHLWKILSVKDPGKGVFKSAPPGFDPSAPDSG